MISLEFLEHDGLFNAWSKCSELFYLTTQNFVGASNGEIALSTRPFSRLIAIRETRDNDFVAI